jgi:MFS family permease
MTIGRLYGDAIVIRIGNQKTLVYGSLLTIIGFSVLLLSGHIAQAMFGFVLIGFGSSNLVPVVFRLAGEQKVMPSTLAIAAVTTTGYAGILLGPALIGFISQATSLKFSFIALALLTLLIPFASGRAIHPR